MRHLTSYQQQLNEFIIILSRQCSDNFWQSEFIVMVSGTSHLCYLVWALGDDMAEDEDVSGKVKSSLPDVVYLVAVCCAPKKLGKLRLLCLHMVYLLKQLRRFAVGTDFVNASFVCMSVMVYLIMTSPFNLSHL